MRCLEADRSALVLIDFQARLMPAIADGAAAVAAARRLQEGARLLQVPVLVTEQIPAKLGATVTELAAASDAPFAQTTFAKTTFDAARAPGFIGALPARSDLVVAGCEAHVCVLQTVLGLLDLGRRVFVVADAIGSRRPESREAAVARMQRHGAEIVTTEMVLFEWLGDAAHPRFRDVMALIK